MRSTAVREHVQRRRPRSRASTGSSGRSTPIANAERWMPAGPGRARVRFDPDALADDLARLSPPGRTALRHAHERFEREGVPLDPLRACQDEHRAGTSLPGCLKVYLPDWGRRLAHDLSDRDRRGRASAQLSRLRRRSSVARHTSSRRLPDRPPSPSRPMAQATAVIWRATRHHLDRLRRSGDPAPGCRDRPRLDARGRFRVGEPGSFGPARERAKAARFSSPRYT